MQILGRRRWWEDGREIGWQWVLLNLLLIVDDDVGALPSIESGHLILEPESVMTNILNSSACLHGMIQSCVGQCPRFQLVHLLLFVEVLSRCVRMCWMQIIAGLGGAICVLVLQIEHPTLQRELILRRGCWIVPWCSVGGGGLVRVPPGSHFILGLLRLLCGLNLGVESLKSCIELR